LSFPFFILLLAASGFFFFEKVITGIMFRCCKKNQVEVIKEQGNFTEEKEKMTDSGLVTYDPLQT
jgi:hypothetical protein